MQTLLEAKGVKYVLESIGNEHKYQIRIVLLIALQYLFRSFFMIYFAFIAQAPTFQCTNEDGSPYDCYENNGGCVEQKFSPNSPSSLAIDVGLYCDQAYYRSLGSSVFFLGGNIGVAIFSKISDDYGRKPAMVYSYAVGATSLLLLGIATVGPWSYLLFLMMIWGGMSCFLAISLTYVAEFSSEKFARTASAALLLSIVIAELIIIFLAYFITSWKVLYLTCIGIPAVVTLISFQYMDETPFFLYGKKQVNKTIEVLQKVAITNEKPLPIENNIQTEAVVQAAKKVEDETVQQVKKWNYWEILVHPKLTMRVLIYSGIRLYLCMAFWGCIFSLSSLGGSITTNSAIAAVAEGLGYLLSMKAHLFQTRILLKGSLSIVMIMGFSFMLVPILECDSSFICSRLFLQGVLSLVMRTAVCFVYGFIYSVGNELFPPEVRSQSNGIAGVASDAGGMITPFVLLFAQALNLNPLLVLGVIGAIPLVASQYLAEDEITSLEEVSPGTEMKYMKMTDQEQPQTE